jgi:hypothetical protein
MAFWREVDMPNCEYATSEHINIAKVKQIVVMTDIFKLRTLIVKTIKWHVRNMNATKATQCRKHNQRKYYFFEKKLAHELF